MTESKKLDSKAKDRLTLAVGLIVLALSTIFIYHFSGFSVLGYKDPEKVLADTDCVNATFDVYSCVYDSDNKTVNIILQSLGSSDIGGFEAVFSYEDGTDSRARTLGNYLDDATMESYTVERVNKEPISVAVASQCEDVYDSAVCL